MKKQLLSFAMAAVAVSMSLSNANAQTGNVGIGTSAPLNKLHVKPNTVDPIRAEGLQVATDPEVVTTDVNGVLHKRAYPTATSSMVTSSGNGYFNNCGCTKTAILTSLNGPNYGASNLAITVTASQFDAILADPTVCDIAISLPGTYGVTNNPATVQAQLPLATNYTGRVFYTHFALPFQFTGDGSVGLFLQHQVGQPGGAFLSIAGSGRHGEAEGSGATVFSINVLYGSAYMNISGGSPVKLMTTIMAISDGVRWWVSENGSDCYVWKP